MAGYVPVFSGVLEGTLFGKWPHTGIWLALLSQVDKNGEIDQVPALLAAKIGCPLDDLLMCLRDFCEPDPDSRSDAEEGRRLVLLDPERRDWGWRVVNHAEYRERARKRMQQIEATESGRDAERKRIARERAALTRDEPRSPDVSRTVQPRPALSGDSGSQTQTQNQTKEQEGNGATPQNLNQHAWQQWVDHRKSIGKPFKSPKAKTLAMQQLANLGSSDYQQACVDHSSRSGYQGLYQPHQISSTSLQQRLNDGLTGDELDN